MRGAAGLPAALRRGGDARLLPHARASPASRSSASSAARRARCAVGAGRPGHAGWLVSRASTSRAHQVRAARQRLAARGAAAGDPPRARHARPRRRPAWPSTPCCTPAFPDGDGLRVPGTLSGYELAVRAVLGQQITVAAARTLAQRLVERFGDADRHAVCRRSRACSPRRPCWPRPSGDALGQLGIVRQRQAAIVAIARAVAEGRLAAARRRRRARHDGRAAGAARHRRLDGAVHRDARAALARRLPGRRRGAAQGAGRAGQPAGRRAKPKPRRRPGSPGAAMP